MFTSNQSVKFCSCYGNQYGDSSQNWRQNYHMKQLYLQYMAKRTMVHMPQRTMSMVNAQKDYVHGKCPKGLCLWWMPKRTVSIIHPQKDSTINLFQRCLDVHVYCNSICNSIYCHQHMRQSRSWIDNKNMIHVHGRFLCPHKEKLSHDIYRKMEVTGSQYIKQNMSSSEESFLLYPETRFKTLSSTFTHMYVCVCRNLYTFE